MYQKTFIGELSCTIPITVTHTIWGLTRNSFLSQQCHWHRCDENQRFHSRFSPRIRSHIQKGFNPCIRGIGGSCLMKKKNRGRKSRVRVPLRKGAQVPTSKRLGELSMYSIPVRRKHGEKFPRRNVFQIMQRWVVIALISCNNQPENHVGKSFVKRL
jgi:hypothetical protein